MCGCALPCQSPSESLHSAAHVPPFNFDSALFFAEMLRAGANETVKALCCPHRLCVKRDLEAWSGVIVVDLMAGMKPKCV